jgi:uncharacterized membrane protein
MIGADDTMAPLEAYVSHAIGLIGLGIEVFGAVVILSGLAWSTGAFLRNRMAEQRYEAYKLRIGRSLLLGLEVVVAADIVRTISLQLTATSLSLLAGLVLIRTFLSWTLVLEIDGRWPWQRETAAPSQRPAARERPKAA